MELVESLMSSRKWRNVCLRRNIVPPEQVMQWGKVKLALCESNSPLKRNLHDNRLVEAIRLIAPESWGDRTRPRNCS